MSKFEKELVKNLQSADAEKVFATLEIIREKYIRCRHKIERLQKFSVTKFLISYIEHPKLCSISLSIIADGCLELSFVNEVIKYNGTKSLMNIMKSFLNDDIIARACRALGNMAKFEIGFKAVLHLNPISLIVKFLSETSIDNCKQIAVRTLMILGKSSKTRELIAQEHGIVCIAKLLTSSNNKLLICSVRAIASLTQNCNLSFARQLSELDLLKVLVQLHSHSEEAVRNHSLVSLSNLSSVEEIRSCLVKVGAVKLYTDILFTCKSHELNRIAALALCKCLDHIHMWSGNGTDVTDGLKALMLVLQRKTYQNIHLQVISSLSPLAFEYKMSAILLNLNILQILLEILELYIQKNKCLFAVANSKSFISFDASLSKCPEVELKKFSSELQVNIPGNMLNKYVEKIGTESSVSEDVLLSKQCFPYDNSSNIVTNLEQPSSSPVTSDYFSSYSPTSMSSPRLKLSPSLDNKYDFSPLSSDQWSPVSAERENLYHINCYSPVSTHSDTFYSESDALYTQDTKASTEFTSSSGSMFPSNTDKLTDTDNKTGTIIDYISQSPPKASSQLAECRYTKPSKSNNPKSSSPLLRSKSDKSFDTEILVKRKKIKTDDINKDIASESQSQNLANFKVTSRISKASSDYKQTNIPKPSNENTFSPTIDNSIVHFIWQLSFHIGKQTNSQLADKYCFSVLIDYLSYVHNPFPKAAIILFNLIQNRYCFEKLIANGFISELEEKLTPNYSCIHHSSAQSAYDNLISAGRKEAESDYAIGTLSHILVTYSKMEQLNALSAISKLVTEKCSLYKLLFQAKGLAILFDFLSDPDVHCRRKAIISLCELYQSLTKEQKEDDCCFLGTCRIATSSRCSYEESHLNVNFLISNGIQIKANRKKICDNSEYFSALLKGNFLEAKAEQITLSDISAENLTTIFHFLHGCGSSNCCPHIRRITFPVFLDLLSDCDRFLLLNIKGFVEDKLCHHLHPSTISRIYSQSKIHNSAALTKKSLHYALKMSIKQKNILFNTFEELINFKPNLDIIGDIKSLINDIF